MMKNTILAVGATLVVLGCSGLVAKESSMSGSKEHAKSDRHRIEVETVVNASLEDVWQAWTTNEGTQSFFSKKTNVKLEIGGPFELFFDTAKPEGSQGSENCRFLSYIPMEMLSFSWNAPPKFEHARGRHTWVVIRFEQLGPRQVKVKLTHLGWDEMKSAHPNHADEWDQVYDYFAKAWPYVLENLKKRFDDGPRWG